MSDESKFNELYPLHVKLKAMEPKRRAVQDFLDWLEEHGKVIAYWEEDADYPTFDHTTKAALIAGFLGINEAALEREKQAMLESIR